MTDLSSALPLDRRRMFQLAAVLGGSMALGERALAAPAGPGASAAPSLKVAPGTIRLNGNEYWEGPVEDGTDAARSAVARSNYYDPTGLRVAYAVVPPRLVAPMQAAVRLSGGTVPIHTQAAMADFLREGHLTADIRRVRKVYQERMGDAASCLAERAAGRWRIGPLAGGCNWRCGSRGRTRTIGHWPGPSRLMALASSRSRRCFWGRLGPDC